MTAGGDWSAPGRWLPPPPRSPVVLNHDLPLPAAAPWPPVPTRRPRRAPLAVSAALVSVLAVVLAGSAWTQYANSHGAEAAARGYFRALAAGDAAGALAFAAGPPPAADGTYLTEHVLAEQLKIGPINSFSVLGTSTTGGRAVVTVRYTLAFDKSPQVVQDSVPVVRHGRSWRLERVAVHVSLRTTSAGADRLTFAGRPLPATEVLVFPGALPVRPDLAAVAVRTPPHAALSQDHADVQLAAALSDGAVKQLDDAVQAAVRKCLAPASNDPLCPQVQSVRQVPGSLHGTLSTDIAQSNAVAALSDSGHGLVTLDGNASINGTYKVWDFNNIEQSRSEQVTVPLHVIASVDDLSRVYWVGSNG